MLTHSLVRWTQLTRNGIPEFVIHRKPLTTLGETYDPGQPVPVALASNRTRLRQLYEQRLVTPRHAPKNSVQATRSRPAVARPAVPTPPPAAVASQASRKTADIILDADVPLVEVEVEVPSPRPLRPKYVPAQARRRRL